VAGHGDGVGFGEPARFSGLAAAAADGAADLLFEGRDVDEVYCCGSGEDLGVPILVDGCGYELVDVVGDAGPADDDVYRTGFMRGLRLDLSSSPEIEQLSATTAMPRMPAD